MSNVFLIFLCPDSLWSPRKCIKWTILSQMSEDDSATCSIMIHSSLPCRFQHVPKRSAFKRNRASWSPWRGHMARGKPHCCDCWAMWFSLRRDPSLSHRIFGRLGRWEAEAHIRIPLLWTQEIHLIARNELVKRCKKHRNDRFVLGFITLVVAWEWFWRLRCCMWRRKLWCWIPAHGKTCCSDVPIRVWWTRIVCAWSWTWWRWRERSVWLKKTFSDMRKVLRVKRAPRIAIHTKNLGSKT